ncbi:O-acyltransferase like protein-like [Synchiropus splendidus]|uniref:O-acyltransferase like protein-like n=1 Tax=Synchiropus splendidus TaxID=270530 RepID=UPI00237EA171|nr:O-acyltransferase like protein-like [Synchiropus splendidus]
MASGYLLLLLIASSSALEKCMNDTDVFLQELSQDKPKDFAVVMYDSFGKMGSNVRGGNLNRPGLMSECRSVHTASFSGQYCQVFLTQGDLFYFVGVCVPDSCDDKEVHMLMLEGRLKVGEVSLIPPLPSIFVNESKLEVMSTYCLSNAADPDASGIACLVICAVLVAIPLAATLVTAVRTCQQSKEKAPAVEPFCLDEGKSHGNFNMSSSLNYQKDDYSTREDKQHKRTQKSFLSRCLHQFLEAFSLQTTTQGVLSTPASVKDSYPSLNGIRALSMLWIISGHSLYTATLYPTDNIKSLQASLKTNPLHVFTVGGANYLGVDTFLFLGGLLSAKSLLSSIQRNEDTMSPSLVADFYFKRIRRVQPLHMFVVMLCEGVSSVFNGGPLLCLPWTWYLSLDFQCYATTPLLILAHRKNKVVFAVLVVTLLLMTILTGSILTALLHLPVFQSEISSSVDFTLFYYQKPYSRYGPFLIGILFGVYLKTRKATLLKKKWQAALGWICSLSVLALVVGLSYALQDTPDHPSAPHAIYQGLHRTAWATALTWVVLACEEGYGGFIMNLLSLKFWLPLSNLSFSCYLIHPLVVYIYIGLQETPIHYLDINFMYMFVGHVALTVVLSYVVTVLVERPFILLKWK